MWAVPYNTAMKQSGAVDTFKVTLSTYKQSIDDDIAAYSKVVQKDTARDFTAYSRVATDAFLEILSRGGKRIRGALVMAGYDMLADATAESRPVILQAARAIEMTHAYILIIDDIQDRSPVRRGGPTAHYLLADYHRKHNLAGQAEHFGVAIALNAALTGAHLAQHLLASLDESVVTQSAKLQAIDIVNQTMVITAHGQTNDIFNESVPVVTEHEADNVLEWKTAHYTFLNPLMVGMTLAGASQVDARAVEAYAMHAGRAYQITDDILGTFGNEFESGKSPLDDIKEGKRTLLVTYVLEHAPKADQYFLLQMLGNEHLSLPEFERCKQIITECGALTYAKDKAKAHVASAVAALEQAAAQRQWQPSIVLFLRGLVEYLPSRHA